MTRNKKLSQDEISQITALGREGKSYRDLETQYNVSRQTVSMWVHRDQENEGLSTPKPMKRSIRPRKLSKTFTRLLKRLITDQPTQSARELRVNNHEMLSNVATNRLQPVISTSSLQTLVNEDHEGEASVFFARSMKDGHEQWSKVIFSDESMFRMTVSRPKHVRRPPGSKR